MNTMGFDNVKYIETQSEQIAKRLSQFGEKLYLEFGGKLFDDHHASRVLPGFLPDSKLKMLLQLKERAEIVIAINAAAIGSQKKRGDIGITYDMEVLRLIDAFEEIGLYVGSVVITQYTAAAEGFRRRLKSLGIRVFRHYTIEGYPSNVPLIVSEQGYGKNDYIQTSRELVVVTAPGPGCGKMATCLSQLYHEHKRGVKAGYAKFETFPIWNIPLEHPVNLAYEAATADLNDVNMIDPYHLQAYGAVTVNYNRDVEIFPVLRAIFEKIYGQSPYQSPTDMGVNMVGNCIVDDAVVCAASREEIVRRYFAALLSQKRDEGDAQAVGKIELLMNQAGVGRAERTGAAQALSAAKKTGRPAAAIRLKDGRIITGKTKALLGAAAAMLLNALKALAGIPDNVTLISADVIAPVQSLKVRYLGNRNPRLHTDEVLIALSVCAASDANAAKAMECLPQLSGCDAHASVILSDVDADTLRKLGVLLTCEPEYEGKQRYHK